MIYKNFKFFLLIYFTLSVFNISANAKSAPESFADIAEKLMPSVVNIATTQTIKTSTNQFPFEFPPGSPFEDLFKEFEFATGLNRSDLIKEAGYDSTIVGGGNEVIIYDPRRIKSMFNQGTFNPLTGDLHTNLGLGTNYASRA